MKKDLKNTYMMTVEGQLKELYQRLDNDYNLAHEHPETDSGVDTGSEGERSVSSSWQHLGARWKKNAQL